MGPLSVLGQSGGLMKRKIQVFDYQEINKLLDRIERLSHVEYGKEYKDKTKYQSLYCFSFCKFNPKNVIITTRWGENLLPTTYVFTRDHTEYHLKQGSEEYGIFKRCTKDIVDGVEVEYVPDFANDKWTIQHVGKEEGKFQTKNSGIQEYNPKFLFKKTFCYEYDLNSAYLSVLYKQMPDTNHPVYNRILEDNEIGFIVRDELTLITTPGSAVEIAFPLIETPKKIKEYCERWFERKRNKSKNAKHQIVDSIGYLQYHNPYLRAYIVESCNNYIKSLMNKETTILCNTDAIFSTVPLDLNIGLNIGEFKVKEGYIKISGLDYESEEFGDVHRGKQRNNYYEVVNNRLVYIGE